MFATLAIAALKAAIQAILGWFGYVPTSKAQKPSEGSTEAQTEDALNVVNKSVVAGADVSAKLDGMPDSDALRDSLKGDPNSLD